MWHLIWQYLIPDFDVAVQSACSFSILFTSFHCSFLNQSIKYIKIQFESAQWKCKHECMIAQWTSRFRPLQKASSEGQEQVLQVFHSVSTVSQSTLTCSQISLACAWQAAWHSEIPCPPPPRVHCVASHLVIPIALMFERFWEHAPNFKCWCGYCGYLYVLIILQFSAIRYNTDWVQFVYHQMSCWECEVSIYFVHAPHLVIWLWLYYCLQNFLSFGSKLCSLLQIQAADRGIVQEVAMERFQPYRCCSITSTRTRVCM